MYSTANISIRDSFLLFFFVALFVCLFFTKTKKEKLAKKKTGTQNSVHPVNPMRRKPQKTDEQTKRFNVLNARKSKSLKNEYPSKKKTNKQTMPTRGNENDPIICCVTLFPPKNLETISRLFIFVWTRPYRVKKNSKMPTRLCAKKTRPGEEPFRLDATSAKPFATKWKASETLEKSRDGTNCDDSPTFVSASHRLVSRFSQISPSFFLLPPSPENVTDVDSSFFFLRLLLGPLSVFLPPFLTPLSTRFIFSVISLFFFITQPSTWCVTLFPPFALPSTPFFRFTFFFGFKGGCVTFYMGGLPPPI